ncbi:uncharacterized protein LOC144568722 isoform X2 [Carex rostrata]
MKKANMGHPTLTCKLYTRASSSIKIISVTDGTITKFQKPVRASELMVENPGWFVCDSAELGVGLRVPGLTADEKLQPSHLYFLLPVDMLYSVLTDEEMDSLSYKASIAFKKGAGAECIEDRAGDVIETFEIVRRDRPWRPALDTIMEVC